MVNIQESLVLNAIQGLLKETLLLQKYQVPVETSHIQGVINSEPEAAGALLEILYNYIHDPEELAARQQQELAAAKLERQGAETQASTSAATGLAHSPSTAAGALRKQIAAQSAATYQQRMGAEREETKSSGYGALRGTLPNPAGGGTGAKPGKGSPGGARERKRAPAAAAPGFGGDLTGGSAGYGGMGGYGGDGSWLGGSLGGSMGGSMGGSFGATMGGSGDPGMDAYQAMLLQQQQMMYMQALAAGGGSPQMQQQQQEAMMLQVGSQDRLYLPGCLPCWSSSLQGANLVQGPGGVLGAEPEMERFWINLCGS